MDGIGWLLLEFAVKITFVITFILMSAAALVYMERRVSAFIQNRIGPNRTGPFGVLQPFADVLKLFMKEDFSPEAADNTIHRLAPIITLGVAVSVFAVIPFAHYITIGEGESARTIYMGLAPNVNIGILYILAMTSVGVYGITLAGWSSNSKYSLLGGLRSSAQMISYELSMGLSVMGVIIVCESFTLNDIILHQANWNWNVFLQPVGFIIFLTSAFAETNRHPFDLPEAEPELVAGYNTEYTGMKFGMFFLAEYANMAVSAILISLLYFGGWHLPFPAEWLGLEAGSVWLALAQFIVFFIKLNILTFFFVWVRWSLPRFRYDQLMNLGWKVLLPLALINVMVTAAIKYIF